MITTFSPYLPWVHGCQPVRKNGPGRCGGKKPVGDSADRFYREVSQLLIVNHFGQLHPDGKDIRFSETGLMRDEANIQLRDRDAGTPGCSEVPETTSGLKRSLNSHNLPHTCEFHLGSYSGPARLQARGLEGFVPHLGLAWLWTPRSRDYPRIKAIAARGQPLRHDDVRRAKGASPGQLQQALRGARPEQLRIVAGVGRKMVVLTQPWTTRQSAMPILRCARPHR